MSGLRETMVLTIVAIFFATLVGILIGFLGVIPNKLCQGIATTFILYFPGTAVDGSGTLHLYRGAKSHRIKVPARLLPGL